MDNIGKKGLNLSQSHVELAWLNMHNKSCHNSSLKYYFAARMCRYVYNHSKSAQQTRVMWTGVKAAAGKTNTPTTLTID